MEKNSVVENVTAMVHSLQATDKVAILEHKDNNHVIAQYKGKRYTAVFNPFVGLYYVDDIYGNLDEVISDRVREAQEKLERCQTDCRYCSVANLPYYEALLKDAQEELDRILEEERQDKSRGDIQ